MVTAIGTPRNDIFAGTMESDYFNGLEGYDVVSRYHTSLQAGSFATLGGATVSYATGTEVDVYVNIEQVDFLDGRMVFGVDDPLAQVYRLYDAAFDRAPDQAGLNLQAATLYRGGELTQLADNFISSPEFMQRYGESLSDAGFVEQLYQNVLGRHGETAGIQGWLDVLGSGTSRAQVLVGFSESNEHREIVAPEIASGLWDRSEDAALVARLYDSVFDRLPDFYGLAFWTDQLDRGILAADDVANRFLASAEAEQHYGSDLSNADLVQALYFNTLGRDGEEAGMQHWVSALDAGAMTRAQVLLGFSESVEHQLLTASTVGGEAPDSYGITFA
jgi:hypothetical protein